MTHVTECINLYLYDDVVTAAQFRAIMREAAELDAIDLEARVTYWNNLQEARKEREAQKGAA